MKYQFRQHPSKLATLAVTYGGGRRAERNVPEGIAHFMEHFRFKGTEKYTSKELTRLVAFHGGSWNAFTSDDLVSYHISIPAEKVEEACEYLSQITLHPTFPEDELEREKEVVCQEVRMYEDDISALVHWDMMGSIFSNTLARRIVGTEDSVRSITRDDLERFNRDIYSPEHMLVSLSAPDDRLDLVEKYFGIPDDILVYPAKDVNPKYAPGFSHKVYKDGLIQQTLVVAFAGEGMYDLAKRPVGKVFNAIFGGGSDARLFDRIRDDMGLVYGIYSSMQHNMDGDVFSIGTETDPENVSKVLETVDEEIVKISSELVADEELQRAKNRIRSSEYRGLDSSESACFKSVYEEFYGLESGSKYLADIDAVTAEQVREFAQNVFSKNKYTVIGLSEEKIQDKE